jgi:hypothetical protein
MMPRLLFAMAVTSVLADWPEVGLLDGTPVEVRLLRVIASDISVPGDPVQLAVNADVIIDSVVVIEKGTPVAGAISEAGPSQLWSRPARLSFVIRHTSSISGQTIRLRTSRDTPGEQRIEIHNHRSALLLWAAPGKTFRAFVDGDYAVPAPLQATPHAPRDDVLTNEHVVRLLSAGISEELVIAKIHAARTAFRVGPDDLIELKQAGVSDRVMLAMIDVTHDVIRLPTPAIK